MPADEVIDAMRRVGQTASRVSSRDRRRRLRGVPAERDGEKVIAGREPRALSGVGLIMLAVEVIDAMRRVGQTASRVPARNRRGRLRGVSAERDGEKVIAGQMGFCEMGSSAFGVL